MHIISKPRLKEFWESRKADSAIAQRDFMAWYKLTKNANWGNYGELKQTFGSADQVGNCTVFDVGNNRFRLITRVIYAAGIVYVLKPMDHAEYDKQYWVKSCGCHQPPPKRPVTPKKVSSVKASPRGRKEGSKRWQSKPTPGPSRTPTSSW